MSPPPLPPPKPPDPSPLVRALLVRFAVALGAAAGLTSLWWGAPLHLAAGRGALAWFLVLALSRVLVPIVRSSAQARATETPTGTIPSAPER